MSDYECSNCKHPVAINTRICPNCGGEFSLFGPVTRVNLRLEAKREEMRQSPEYAKNGWAVIPLAIVTLAVWYFLGDP